MTDSTHSPQHTDETTLGCSHQPYDVRLWQGRAEPDESARARYWYQIVEAYQDSIAPPVGIVGYACDQGVRRNLGRVGAKEGPTAIRSTFAKLPISAALQDAFTPTQLTSLIGDVGDVICHDSDQLAQNTLEQTQATYSEHISNVLHNSLSNSSHQTIPTLAVGLGGGHAIAYASYMGLWQALQTADKAKASIGIINFDAHLDIRQAPVGTSGTPFRQIAEHNQSVGQPFHYCCIGVSQYSNTAALFDRAKALAVNMITDDDCYRLPWLDIATQLDAFLANVDYVYITIDMDGFPASVVPGVSAPAAKGISLDFAERCLAHIFATSKVKVVDIAELNPTYDIDAHSAKVAARLLALLVEQHLITHSRSLDAG